MATDNTLTLIFDSDEEGELEDEMLDDPNPNGEIIIKEVDDEEEDPCYDGVIGTNNSLIFNDEDESKIERASSIGGGNTSRINNNLVTSNSFQADNSLLFFTNNIVIRGSSAIGGP